ncbi:histidine kinase [Pilimelia anulata]|uniref:histidine kinase n=1 Tax=Pilimelia anulata TaxID=53371 RepID=A0A8J3FDN0_9ACTN|nr:ATP-binding protein [Pilimelia anulata]GGJ96842.1 histidine kinase [Pilimelia anulata]
MPSGLTAQQWFARALAVFGALLAAAALAGWFALDRTGSTTRVLVEDVALSRAAAGELRSALVDQETGVRGYLLARDPSFLAPYAAGRQREDTAQARLHEYLAAHSAPRVEADRVASAAADWRAAYAEPITRGGAAPAAAVGKARFDAVRDGLAALDRELLELRETQRAVLAGQTRWQTGTLVGIVALVVLAVLALSFGLHRGVVRPLRRLGEDTRRVVEGDTFDHRVAATGVADLRRLGTDIDAMRQRIVAELTATRRARDDLQRSRDELERNRDELQRGRDELEQNTVELRRSNAELEQFAYVASHDLQEPLRKITSFCQLLERRYNDLLDERGRQYIAFAVDGASRLQVLINDLLRFSRVGRMYSGRTSVDLADVGATAERNIREMLDEAGGSVAIDPLPTVVGDPTLLTMLLQNLIHNAVKFAKPDVPPEVAVTCARVDDRYELAVTDNGIGVPPEFADKIFVIFQRLHTRDAYPGTGIGLAICKKVVEYHGGRIALDPAHTDGTRISFSLPVPSENTPPTPPTEDRG